MGAWRCLAAIAICAVAAPAHAGEELSFGKAPSWVVEFPRAESAELDANLPAHVRLTDFQTRLEAGRTSHYIALEIEIRSSEGLSAGNLSLSWQPEFDEVTVHHVRIDRGGEVTDVLADGQTFTVLRREQNLEEAMLTGVLTANLFPSGLEVGDVLQFAYTVSESNPVLAGNAETAIGPLNGVVGQTHLRISWPDDVDLQVTSHQDLPALERTHRDGHEAVSLVMGLREPILPPAGAPARFQLVRMVEASTFDTWGEVAQLFVPLYEAASRIPPDGPLREALEEIRAASEDPVVRAEMALALVQNRIRYVALAMGAGGLVPADTTTTWARRFGDCKAKSALLLGLLRELGIDAEPVLVSTSLGDALPQRLPMVSAFDHVLVRAHVQGREYFLDGTRRGDTSLARTVTPHYVWGLPVTEAASDLVTMIAPPLAEPNEQTTVRIDASSGLRAPAPTEIETILRGDAAIALNATMSQFVGQVRRQVLDRYWRENYDYVTPESVDMRFDAASGVARLTLAGSATLDWDYNSFEPNGLRVGYTPDFTRAPGAGHDAPFAVPHPFFSSTRFEITLPDGFTEQEIDGEDVNQTVAGVEYRRELALEGNVFTATRSARSMASEFPATAADEAKQTLERLWDQRVLIRIPQGYRFSRAEIDAVTQADNASPQALIDQGVALMNQSEWEAARTLFDKIVEIDPRNAWGWGNRAVVNANLGDGEAAERDAAQALVIDPAAYVAHHARGLLAMAKLDYAAAVSAFTNAIELHQNNGFALRQRAGAYVGQEEFDAALTDARRLIAMEPEVQENYLLLGIILAHLRREDELNRHVEVMLARFPDDQGVRAAASELFYTMGADDKADALLTAPVDGEPSAVVLAMSARRRPVSETDAKLAELDQALSIAPDYVPALLLRANTLWMEYRYQPALADVNRALELAPRLAEAYDIKVKILQDMNRRSEALRTVDEMAENSAIDAAGLVMAAAHYARLGNAKKARETAERARELAPESEFVQEASRHLP